nr:hypothetical protein CPGR_02752 [Mycolicibacter nonchromogenicus]
MAPNGLRSTFWIGRRLARSKITLPLVSTARCRSKLSAPSMSRASSSVATEVPMS